MDNRTPENRGSALIFQKSHLYLFWILYQTCCFQDDADIRDDLVDDISQSTGDGNSGSESESQTSNINNKTTKRRKTRRLDMWFMNFPLPGLLQINALLSAGL